MDIIPLPFWTASFDLQNQPPGSFLHICTLLLKRKSLQHRRVVGLKDLARNDMLW